MNACNCAVVETLIKILVQLGIQEVARLQTELAALEAEAIRRASGACSSIGICIIFLSCTLQEEDIRAKIALQKNSLESAQSQAAELRDRLTGKLVSMYLTSSDVCRAARETISETIAELKARLQANKVFHLYKQLSQLTAEVGVGTRRDTLRICGVLTAV